MTFPRPPKTHADRGRAVENAGAWVGTVFFALFGVVELVLRLGLDAHPGEPIPRYVLVLMATCFIPKGAGTVTKGGIWNLLKRAPK